MNEFNSILTNEPLVQFFKYKKDQECLVLIDITVLLDFGLSVWCRRDDYRKEVERIWIKLFPIKQFPIENRNESGRVPPLNLPPCLTFTLAKELLRWNIPWGSSEEAATVRMLIVWLDWRISALVYQLRRTLIDTVRVPINVNDQRSWSTFISSATSWDFLITKAAGAAQGAMAECFFGQFWSLMFIFRVLDARGRFATLCGRVCHCASLIWLNTRPRESSASEPTVKRCVFGSKRQERQFRFRCRSFAGSDSVHRAAH